VVALKQADGITFTDKDGNFF